MITNFQQRAANERTFLSWVRTVIAIVGFGLVASRLDGQKAALWSETLMMIAGAIVLVLAFWRMRRIHKNIRLEQPLDEGRIPAEALLLLLTISLFGLLGAFALHVS